MVPTVTPQLVGNVGVHALKRAIEEPDRYAFEVKVDGFRGLAVFDADGEIATFNRRAQRRQWLRGQPLETSLRRLGRRVPLLHRGTVLDGEIVANGFRGTMPAIMGSKGNGDQLRFVVFDVPILAGVDLRDLSWTERRERLELLASAFEGPVELSPVIEPSTDLARHMANGAIDGIVIKDRTSPYRDGGRSGWFKLKDRSWYEREAWRFDRR